MNERGKDRVSLTSCILKKYFEGYSHAWSDFANFIGEMVAKYAEAMDLDSLPDPDHYLLMKRIKQLYVAFYKEKNIEKFRNEKLSIERKAVA